MCNLLQKGLTLGAYGHHGLARFLFLLRTVRMSNLTLINLVLYVFGPCREDVLGSRCCQSSRDGFETEALLSTSGHPSRELLAVLPAAPEPRQWIKTRGDGPQILVLGFSSRGSTNLGPFGYPFLSHIWSACQVLAGFGLASYLFDVVL